MKNLTYDYKHNQISYYQEFIAILFVFSCSSYKSKNPSPTKTGYNYISPSHKTIIDVIVGKFPGVEIIGNNIGFGNTKVLPSY